MAKNDPLAMLVNQKLSDAALPAPEARVWDVDVTEADAVKMVKVFMERNLRHWVTGEAEHNHLLTKLAECLGNVFPMPKPEKPPTEKQLAARKKAAKRMKEKWATDWAHKKVKTKGKKSVGTRSK